MKAFLAATLAFGVLSSAALADTYTVTVTNNLTEELFAPIVVTDAGNDSFFFVDGYVTPAAESQILTGDPAQVVEAIGMDNVTVGHGADGPPGVLLAAGESVTFEVTTDSTALRILAMVAPTMVPDNYVTALADVHTGDDITVNLDRFDIGFDEETKTNVWLASNVGTVHIVRGM